MRERCAKRRFGIGLRSIYRVILAAVILIGATSKLAGAWAFFRIMIRPMDALKLGLPTGLKGLRATGRILNRRREG